MSRNVRTYEHFCMVARALEQVGDRWTLLVVRDLLVVPRRFTDLMARLGGITPKTLTHRLRQLEDAGIVEVDRQDGRREVWYRLTPAGKDLAPVVESLFRWGLRHAGRPPVPGETVHVEHLLSALRIVLDQAPAPPGPLVWQLELVDDGAYTLRYADGRWAWAPGADPTVTPDVVITADTGAWTRFLMTSPDGRTPRAAGVDVTGSTREVDRLLRLLTRFPPSPQPSRTAAGPAR